MFQFQSDHRINLCLFANFSKLVSFSWLNIQQFACSLKFQVSGGGHGYTRPRDVNSHFVNQASWEQQPGSSQGTTRRTDETRYGSIWWNTIALKITIRIESLFWVIEVWIPPKYHHSCCCLILIFFFSNQDFTIAFGFLAFHWYTRIVLNSSVVKLYIYKSLI